MANVAQIDYQVLADKAKKIEEQRSLLKAKEDTLSKQVEELHSSLVQEYGENYMALFDEAAARIQQWDLAHA
jgi:hypothetical protein